MRKYLNAAFIAGIAVVLISWGGSGHKTVATIAYNHLTPNAKHAVKTLLGDTSMADVASWADEIRMKPAYKFTTPRHYVDLPLGLSFKAFSDTVTGQPADNAYKAVIQCKKDLLSKTTSREQKAVALKFLIHFVGDLHQPMHVSRAEDQGGNTIQLQYDGKGTNLHSLWDSKLIGTEGKSFDKMAIDYDTATKNQIIQWQSDPIMQWLWESYKITTKLYAEVESNNKLDDNYFKSHINIVHERIEMGGIRLAGILNNVFKDQVITASKVGQVPIVKELSNSKAYSPVELNDVSKHIGESVNVKVTVSDYKKFDNMLLVNVGAPYPNNPLTLVFRGDLIPLGETVVKSAGRMLYVLGTLVEYKGKPQIEITNTNQVLLAPSYY